LLEHRDGEVVLDQVADDQAQKRPIDGDIGAQQDSVRLQPTLPFERRSEQCRRQMQDREGAAGHRHPRRGRLQPGLVGHHRQMADLAPRCHPRLGQMGGQTLLEAARRG
jgi:hypothetical protein